MRSADEVVGEVHDDIPAGQIQQHRDEENEDGIDNGDTVGGPTDTNHRYVSRRSSRACGRL